MRRRLVIVGGAVLVVAALAEAVVVARPWEPTVALDAATYVPTTMTPTPSPEATSEQGTDATAGTGPSIVSEAPSSAPPVPPDCSARRPIVPKTFMIDRTGVSSPMLSLGLDGSAPAAPPKNQPYTVGWYRGGPAIGAAKGNAILTAHTYRQGGALGNDLVEGGLQVGDRIRVVGVDGSVQCYTYTGSTKVWVKDYKPGSTVMDNPNGPHQLALVVCWDFDWNTQEWRSRIILYAAPEA